MDAFRAQLDELMGKDRNLLPHEKNGRGQHFSDPDICKNYICGFCPSELFTNTKSDLGPCHKVHDDQCREQYQAEKNKGDYPFGADWIHYLERLIQELDRKIKKAHDRLDTQDALPEVPPENQQQLDDINSQIQTLLSKMEELGEEGRVDESQAMMRVVDRLKAEKEILIRGGIIGLTGNAGLGTSLGLTMGQEKKMRVCETCGAFLVVGDTEKRMASHLEGKQHQGYAKIRQAIEEYHKGKEEELARRRSSGGGAWERGAGGAGGAGGGGAGAGLGGAGAGPGGMDWASMLGGFGMPPQPAASEPQQPLAPPEERFREQLQQLNDMGFTDQQANIAALLQTNGFVQGAIDRLLNS